MRIKANFNTIILVDDGIILGLKNNKKREITFSELDRIYIKEHRLKPAYEFVIILFPFLFILLAIQYIILEEVIFIALFVVVPVFIKIYRYKRNDFMIRLKDGTVFRKVVPFKLKRENITIIKSAKSGWRKYGIKSKLELESLAF